MPRMQGDAGVIERLNGYLQIELTGHKQYLLAAAACAHAGLGRLREAQTAYVHEETAHAERILQRILLLGGRARAHRPGRGGAGGHGPKSSSGRDEALVGRAIDYLRGAVAYCASVGDEGSRGLLVEMLIDEEQHLDWLEQQLRLIATLGAPAYLQQQLGASGPR
jgi:bacterioferritin